jgi:hypothetical protein
MPISLAQNVVIPAWIMTVGLLTLSAPILGPFMSLAVLIVGVVVVPALLLSPGSLVSRTAVIS